MSAQDISIKYTQLFINNEFIDSESGIKFPTYNPATEEEIAQVHEAGTNDVNKAVAAARKAFQSGSEWRSMEPSERGMLICKLAQLMKRDKCELSKLETLNNGKPCKEALDNIEFAIKCLEYYAGWTDKICGKTIPVDVDYFTFTKHEPVGVCAQIIPWNYPITMLAWKIAPALACGNTIVLKPAEQTPLTALVIAALSKEAGFPDGVINIINGSGPTTGRDLAYHNDVNKIAFTGSVEVGRLIQEASAKSNLKRVSLELGGKSPMIITEVDDDLLQKAAEDSGENIFKNQGQNCCGCSRIYVHESVYDKFVKKLNQIAKSKVVGDPFSKETTNGAIINQTQFDKILSYISLGKNEGAKVLTGGERCGDKGYFIRPTIFTDVTDNMRIAREEIFGPVVCLFKYKTIDEVIARANDTSYGLSAGIYSNDISVIIKVIDELQNGTVWVNCYGNIMNQAPFGGYKDSGIGRELGEYGLHEYTEVKNVTIRKNPKD